jgi:hypothetical protein
MRLEEHSDNGARSAMSVVVLGHDAAANR